MTPGKTRPRRPRPSHRAAWARLFGLTAIVAAYLLAVDGQILAAALTAGAATVLLLYWRRHYPSPDYMTTLPYEYVGDLAERPPAAALDHAARLRLAATIAGPVLVGWALAGELVLGLAPAAVLAIGVYEVSHLPGRRATTFAIVLGVGAGALVAGITAILGNGPVVMLGGFLAVGTTAGAIVFLVLALMPNLSRAPRLLL